jgi:hypothetical protein
MAAKPGGRPGYGRTAREIVPNDDGADRKIIPVGPAVIRQAVRAVFTL